MVDFGVDRGRGHPGVPQDLADLGERGPGCQHLGGQAVAEPVRACLGTPDRSQALYTAQVTPADVIAPTGAIARKNTALVFTRGRLRNQAASAAPTSHGSGSRSSRPPLPCTVNSPARQPRSSRDSDATSPARSPRRASSISIA